MIKTHFKRKTTSMRDLTLTICVILLYFQNWVQGLRIYQLNENLSEGKLISQLKRIIRNEQGYDKQPEGIEKPVILKMNKGYTVDSSNSIMPSYYKYNYIKNNINARGGHTNRRKRDRYENMIFVKRIIPHGYMMGNYEYDPILKTNYKPLIRFHVKKPIQKVHKYLINRKHSNRIPNNGDIKNRNFLKKILQPQIIIIDVDNGGKFDRAKKINGLTLKNVDLRSGSVFDKSGEANDPFAPGKNPLQEENFEVVQSTQKPVPEYPFWNYWTYDKSLYFNDCPGSLVKMGNVCVGLLNR